MSCSPNNPTITQRPTPTMGPGKPWGVLALFCIILINLPLAGCATPAGVIFEPLEYPIVWPAPPDEPRIHYVGQISTTKDLKAARPFGAAIHDTLFGKSLVSGLVSPRAIEVDQRNRLFVADSAAQVVHVFDLEKRAYEQWSPAPPNGFRNPVGLERAADGRLFVADSAAGVIWVMNENGRPIDTWGAGELIRPCGMAFDDAFGRLYVADAAAHQVVVLDNSGQTINRIGSRGSAPGYFNFPTDVLIDHAGRLYVSDALNCRIQQFTSDLQPRLQIGSRGDMPGYFSRPKGIAVDSDNHLYVIDAEFESVQIYSDDGTLLMAFGREGRGPGEFWLPSAIVIDATDRLWVADTYNRRVQVFDYRSSQRAAVQTGAPDEVSP